MKSIVRMGGPGKRSRPAAVAALVQPLATQNRVLLGTPDNQPRDHVANVHHSIMELRRGADKRGRARKGMPQTA